MEISYELTRKDFRAFSTFINKRSTSKIWKAIFSWRGFLMMFIYSLAFRMIDVFNLNRNAFFIGIFTSIILRPLSHNLLLSYPLLREDGMSFKRRILSITSEGVSERSETWNCQYSWDEVESLEFRGKYFFIMLEYHRGFIVPHRVFPDESEMKAFVDQAKRYLRNSSKS